MTARVFATELLHSNVPDFDNCAFDFFFYVENDSNTHYYSGSRNPKSRICYTKYLLFSLHHLYFHNISMIKKVWQNPTSIGQIFKCSLKLHHAAFTEKRPNCA